MPRLRELGRDDVSEKMNKLYDLIWGKGKDPLKDPTTTGSPGNWWSVLAHEPGLLKANSAFDYRSKHLSAELREIAIMRVAYVRESLFVFSQHAKIARMMLKLEQKKIDAIGDWQTSDAYTDLERKALAFVDATLMLNGRMSDDLFNSLKDALTERGIVTLLFVTLFFNQHALMCKVLKLEFDDEPDRKYFELPDPKDAGVKPSEYNWRDYV